MRPAQSLGDAFGIRWDPRRWSTRLAIVTFVFSVLLMGAHHLPFALHSAVVDGLVFQPLAVKHGMVWQLLTFGFVEPSPWGLVWAVYSMLVFGADVEDRLGSSAFLAWFVGLTAVASVVTLGLSFVWKAVDGGAYFGADAVALGYLVIWTALHRGAMINFFMVLPMRAELLLYLVVGIVILEAIAAFSPAVAVPELAAWVGAELATRSHLDFSPRRAYLRFRAWQIERALRKRSKHFTVISGGDDPGSKGPGGNGYLN